MQAAVSTKAPPARRSCLLAPCSAAPRRPSDQACAWHQTRYPLRRSALPPAFSPCPRPRRWYTVPAWPQSREGRDDGCSGAGAGRGQAGNGARTVVEMLAPFVGKDTGMEGCSRIELAVDATDPDRVVILEDWTSAEAHKANLAVPGGGRRPGRLPRAAGRGARPHLLRAARSDEGADSAGRRGPRRYRRRDGRRGRGNGMLILVCAMRGDGDDEARSLARKVANLRIFESEPGKMNLSILASGGSCAGREPVHPCRRHEPRQPPGILLCRPAGRRRAALRAFHRLPRRARRARRRPGASGRRCRSTSSTTAR